MDAQQLPLQAQRSLERLFPRLEARFSARQRQSAAWQVFTRRLKTHFPRLFGLLIELFEGRYDFFYHLEELLVMMGESWLARSPQLRQLDDEREANPAWFQSNQMLGGVCYVDLFAGDLAGLRAKLPYFRDLGLTYLHLMPLFKTRPGENDGGYAVSSYREVNPALGDRQQLADLAEALRQAGISLVLDFVLNHTADDHEWAESARRGDAERREYYFIFPDREMPDAYEQHLREIFPDEHPGAFSPLPAGDGWVWTTFHKYQWDLNYANPAVFNQMASEMLSLANLGADVLRLDALAFIWKKMGTVCESLPQAHTLLRAFNAVAAIAAPGLLFKSEAIVHPDDVVKYIHPEECQLSYNPLLMALLWNSLAARDVRLLDLALRERAKIHPACAWVNYVRCHDDIGWTFSDEDAARLGVNGYDHRRFLNDFYTGRFPGSFARGLPFQENPKTGDCRISGSCASLAGLEKALTEETAAEVELAIRRILLIHGVILTIGGIPLIYLGDEVGTLNDYAYRNDPAKAHDSRWVHRPAADWQRIALRAQPDTVEGRIDRGLRQMISMRKQMAAFAGGELEVIHTANAQVLGYVRARQGKRVLVFANFSESEQRIAANLLRLYGLSYEFTDLLSGQAYSLADICLAPYQFVCLAACDISPVTER